MTKKRDIKLDASTNTDNIGHEEQSTGQELKYKTQTIFCAAIVLAVSTAIGIGVFYSINYFSYGIGSSTLIPDGVQSGVNPCQDLLNQISDVNWVGACLASMVSAIAVMIYERFQKNLLPKNDQNPSTAVGDVNQHEIEKFASSEQLG